MRGVVNANPNATKLQESDISLLKIDHHPEQLKLEESKHSCVSYKESFMAWEKNLLMDVYIQEGCSKTQTAERLGISVRSVYQKLKNYSLNSY